MSFGADKYQGLKFQTFQFRKVHSFNVKEQFYLKQFSLV